MAQPHQEKNHIVIGVYIGARTLKNEGCGSHQKPDGPESPTFRGRNIAHPHQERKPHLISVYIEARTLKNDGCGTHQNQTDQKAPLFAAKHGAPTESS
jgi:hypothetical protein